MDFWFYDDPDGAGNPSLRCYRPLAGTLLVGDSRGVRDAVHAHYLGRSGLLPEENMMVVDSASVFSSLPWGLFALVFVAIILLVIYHMVFVERFGYWEVRL